MAGDRGGIACPGEYLGIRDRPEGGHPDGDVCGCLYHSGGGKLGLELLRAQIHVHLHGIVIFFGKNTAVQLRYILPDRYVPSGASAQYLLKQIVDP